MTAPDRDALRKAERVKKMKLAAIIAALALSIPLRQAIERTDNG